MEINQIPQGYIDLGYDIKAELIIEIGSDYVNSPDYLQDHFYYIPGIYFPIETPSATNANTESSNIISNED